MKINSIFLQDIRSYENQEIKFPEGSVLLSGNIGSGKSTVLLALEFALFGLQKGLSGNSLLRNGKNEGIVRAGLEIDGKTVVIERHLKRSKSSITQSYGSIIIDGSKKEISTSEMKDVILKLMNYPPEFLTKNPVLYRYTVYTPQEEMKQILLENKEERLDTLRRVFGIDNYKKITSNIDIVDRKLREIAKSKEGFILDLDRKKNELAEKKKEKEKTKEEIEKIMPELQKIKISFGKVIKGLEEIEEKLKESNKIKTELASIEAELREKRYALEINNEDVSIIKEQIKRIEDEFINSQITPEKLEETLKNFSESLMENERLHEELKKEQILIERKIASVESGKSQKERLISDILKLNSCPTCRQEVSQEYKHEIKERTDSELRMLEEKLAAEERNKKEIERKLSEIKQKISEMLKKEKVISLFSVRIKNLEEKKSRHLKLMDYNKRINSEILSLNKKEEIIREKLHSWKDIENEYKNLKNMVENERQKERQIEIRKAEFEQKFNGICEIIISVEEEINEKEIEKEKVIYINKARDWLSDQFVPLIMFIEKNVMARLHQDFSKLFEKWFSMLTNDLNAGIDSDFTPVIEQSGYQIDYAYLSGGERTAAALAYRLALNQVINNLMSHIKTRELLILDEPTDGFSSEQLDKMRQVLNELKVKQLILVSHEPKIEDFVQRVIRFEKKGHSMVL
jgi:exonuclease SbcC